MEKHRQYIMDALGIHETAGLTRYAISAGITECGEKKLVDQTAKTVPTRVWILQNIDLELLQICKRVGKF